MSTISESWLSGVLESAITIFIFSLTVPTIMFQLYVPEDLKKYNEIISRKMVAMMYGKLGFVLLILVCTIPFSNYFKNPYLSSLNLFLVVLLTIIYLCQVTTAIIGVVTSETTIREEVFDEFIKKINRELSEYSKWNTKFQRQLKYILRHTENGMSKNLIISKIEDFINSLNLNNSSFYTGNELSYFFRDILTDSVVENVDYYSEEHFNRVLSIFKTFILKYDESKVEDSGDILTIQECTYRISNKAIDYEFTSVITNGIDVLHNTPNSELYIYKIGEKNFKSNNINLSLEALIKIAFQIRHDKSDRNVFPYIGLISYFLAKNTALKEIGISILKKHASLINTISFVKVKNYFKKNGLYDVLDKLDISKAKLQNYLTIE